MSKSCADLICQAYHATYGSPVCITRCGNLFGGGDLNWNRLVPGTIRSALRGERPIVRSDGKFVRDYFYVRDAALAYMRLAEQMESAGLAGQAFNFSHEEPLTVLAMVGLILHAAGRGDLEPVILDEASHEIRYQALASVRARELLAWRPTWGISAALAETVEWYRRHVEGLGDRGHSGIGAGAVSSRS